MAFRLWPRPSPDRFARRALAGLRRLGVEGEVEYRADDFVLVLADGAQRINLANAYADCLQLPPWQRRKALLRFLATATVDRPADAETFEEARPRLMPGIRHVAMLDFLELSQELEAQEPVAEGIRLAWRPFTPQLIVCLCLDAPHGIRLVNEGDLVRWGVSFDDALAIARENLAARTPGGFHEVGNGVYASPWADCYDVARLLLPDLLRPLDVDGEVVTVCPNWNVVLLTGARNHAGLAAVLRACLEAFQAPKPISGQPIVYRYPGWELLPIEKGHPCFGEWRTVRVHELHGSYAGQRKLLTAQHERDLVDVYVGEYNGVERDGAVRSYCVWGRGVVALLPETDVVFFFDPDRPQGQEIVAEVDWDIVQGICGGLMRRTEHRLARWAIDSFPTAEQLATMTAAQQTRETAV